MSTALVEKTKKIGLMGHVIANYPSPKEARRLIGIMADAGVKVIEIQIPFSEPMADGPLFMQANHQAIAQGVTTKSSLDLLAEVSSRYDVPFVLMTYANVIFKKGFEAFVKAAVLAGAQGIIVPDLPYDYAEEFESCCTKMELAHIQVIPPNVSEERLKHLCQLSKGLVYAAARSGVTGSRTEFGASLDEFLRRIRRYTDLPVAVGFGVRTPEDVEFLQGRADLAVIGSQGLSVYQQQGFRGVKTFWQSVVGG